ncbi:MAG: S41 family peptidase [Caulobacter sp.]
MAASGGVAPGLQGVWRSRGYGWIVEFDSKGPRLYHVAGEDCWRDPRGEADPDGVLKLWRPAGKGAVEISAETDGTLYRFDRLKSLPRACSDERPWTPRRTLGAVADAFAAYYPLSAERGFDWAARRREAFAALGETPDDAALWRALGVLLRGIADPHVMLEGLIDGEPRSRRFGEASVLLQAQARPGGEAAWRKVWRKGLLAAPFHARQVANGRIFWGRDGDVGYLAIVTMGGFDTAAGDDDTVLLDATLDEAMTAFSGASAVIVDVSNNRGGYDTISRRIASRFAAGRAVAGSKLPAGVTGPSQDLVVEPSKRPRFVGPVWLLTSNITVSAGETFTLMMRGLPNVRQVGETTRGALSDQVPMPFSDDWGFALPVEIHRDAEGRVVEGKGIAPQVPLEVYPPGDLGDGHARALARLLAMIRGS